MRISIVTDGNTPYIYTDTINALRTGKADSRTDPQASSQVSGAAAAAQGADSTSPIAAVPSSSSALKTSSVQSGQSASAAGNNATPVSDFDAVLTRNMASLRAAGAESKEPVTVPADLEKIFRKAAETYGVDEGLLIAIGYHESRFQSDATSSAGAMGIMQLMPNTAAALGVGNAYDPEQNIMGGASLLAGQLRKYNGNASLALAAYSAGGGAVKKYDGIPPYAETENYIPSAFEIYSRGYRTDDGSVQVTPSADAVSKLISDYNSTNGAATNSGSADITDRQRTDLTNLLYNSSALLLREHLLTGEAGA